MFQSAANGGARQTYSRAQPEESYGRTPRTPRVNGKSKRALAHGRQRLSQSALNRCDTLEALNHLQPSVNSRGSGSSASEYSTRSQRGEGDGRGADSAEEMENILEMALEEEEAEHEEKMQATRKHLASDPEGNLYRGWAVGIQKGCRPFIMTMLVIVAQVVGPLVMLYWGHKTMADGLPQPFWTYLEMDDVSLSAGLVNGTTNHTVLHLQDYTDKFFAVQMKVLGTALLLIIFFNGETLLDRQDRQTDRLRYLFPSVKRSWMITDAGINSWCISMSALAAPFLILTADGAKDLVLDAFGLLFLASLDEYSASIEFGIETSDFDDIVDAREQELGEDEFGIPDPRGSLLREGTEEGLLEQYESRSGALPSHSWDHMWVRVQHGDLFFSVARQMNLIAGCFSVPAFICTRWDAAAEPGPGEPPLEPVYPLRDTFCTTRMCIGAAVLIFLAHIPYVIDFARQKNRDFIGFVFIVLFRGRGDPREADPDGDDDDL